jgi:hypothetical protein
LLRFIIAVAILTAGLPPILSFVSQKTWISGLPSFLHESTWLVAFITTIIFVYLYRLHRLGKPGIFVQFYLLSMVVKLLACFAYTILIILEDRPGAVANVVYLLIVYFLYTALEITFLYRRISPPSGS